MRVGFSLIGVGGEGGIAIVGVKGDLAASVDVDEFDLVILKHVGNLYFSNVVETIFELIVRSESRGERYTQRVAGQRISCNC